MFSARGLRITPINNVVPDTGSFTTQPVDGESEGVAWMFQAEDTNAITHLGFRYATATGTPPTYRISLQGIDSSGMPDGTVKGGGTPASALFTPTSENNNTFAYIALDNSYTPSLGEFLCSVIEWSSGTINTSNRMQWSVGFSAANYDSGSADNVFPYRTVHAGSSWAKQGNTPIYGVRTASSRYGNPISATASLSSVSASTHRHALKFRIPPGFCTSFKIPLMRIFARTGTSGNITYGIWNAAGSAIQTVVQNNAHAINTVNGFLDLKFTSPVAMYPDVWYYAGVQANGLTTVGVAYQNIASGDDRLAYPMGTNALMSTWNGGTSEWTDFDDQLPAVELLLSEIVPLVRPRFALAV